MNDSFTSVTCEAKIPNFFVYYTSTLSEITFIFLIFYVLKIITMAQNCSSFYINSDIYNGNLLLEHRRLSHSKYAQTEDGQLFQQVEVKNHENRPRRTKGRKHNHQWIWGHCSEITSWITTGLTQPFVMICKGYGEDHQKLCKREPECM